MDEVSLLIDGKEWQGWTAVTISRALKAISGEIKLTLTRKWTDAKVLPLTEGLPMVVNIGEDRVATGYISEFIPSYDSKEVRYELICHDKTVDLADCAVVHKSGEFRNATLDTIAKLVCKPFGINVVVECDIGASFGTARLEQGETAFEFLERLARQRGVLLTSNAYGDLVLTQASDEQMPNILELGKNIRAARGRFSQRERFNQVIVKGTVSTSGWESNSFTQSVVVRDDSVARYRPQIVMMEEGFTVAGASKRGKWQMADNVAKENTIEITVDGWRIDANPSKNLFVGELWRTNRRIKLIDPILDKDEVLLISDVSFIENEEGRVTVLSLVPPESMIVEPETVKSSNASSKDKW